VTPEDLRLPPGELQRLAECILEPIRFPGTIQPHGLFLAARLDTLAITHASDNAVAVIGAEPIALLGRPLADLLGDATVASIFDVLDPVSSAANPVRLDLGNVRYDVISHTIGSSLVVELEPLEAGFPDQTAALRGAFRRLTNARTVQELWDETAAEVARITGFDRVMVYYFHPDEHGEVVAEVAAPGMEPYKGLHYPASDIPAQARELYLTKLSRMIASSLGGTAALLADGNVPVAESFDLSGAELRSVSPHHLEFMRNMGQASTFSLSLVSRNRLVGMITCAHRTERRIPFGTRESLEILANQVSLQQAAMTEIERLSRLNRIREIRAKLMAQVGEGDDIPGSLLHGPQTLLSLIPADGVVICFGDELHTAGTVPTPEQLDEFLARLPTPLPGHLFVGDALPLEQPDLAAALPGVAGVLLHTFGRDGEFVAWFRGELTQTVDWLGDMSPDNRITPLSPRNSFSSWTQEVSGTAEPWQGLEDEATELCRDLESVLLHRAESALAALALHDPLTGLPNRRLLMDRLGNAIERHARSGSLAVLFLDLDGFKRINDTLGHAAGDDALQFVARKLTAAARAGDTVARLGGDEFVLLCEELTFDEAREVAERIAIALSQQEEPTPGWTVSASIGIAMAEAGLSPSQVLSAADAEMYRVKVGRSGRSAG
jgi:chemotaxis family two-component system sensor kinase Cph1